MNDTQLIYGAIYIGGFIIVGAIFAYYIAKSDDNDRNEL